jgi:hypothetical protein
LKVARTRKVVKMDTLREWAVSALPPMHTARTNHAAVYHSQFLYALGGYNDAFLSERYVCEESRWEVLPALPVACLAMSAVELDNSLYVLGGHDGDDLDTVQKLSLGSLTWELMQLKLPQAAMMFPCFKTDTEVYLVIRPCTPSLPCNSSQLRVFLKTLCVTRVTTAEALCTGLIGRNPF